MNKQIVDSRVGFVKKHYITCQFDTPYFSLEKSGLRLKNFLDKYGKVAVFLNNVLLPLLFATLYP